MLSDKRFLTACAIGFGCGSLFLLLQLLSNALTSSNRSEISLDVSPLLARTYSVPESLEKGQILQLFGIEKSDGEVGGGDLLPELESHSVKILAQASIAGKGSTLLEVVSQGKTVQQKAEVGVTINGLLVKSIEDKKIVIEKDGNEYVIKLFHQKKLK